MTRACVFDAYGTLFDFDAAIAPARAALGGAADRLSEVWRTKQLQYTWLRTLQGAHTSFRQVTREALDHAMRAVGCPDVSVADELMAAYDRLPAFPDAGGALRALREGGLPLAILSNGDTDMLAGALAASGLAGLFDAVLSAEAAGAFKTDRRVYQLAIDRFDAAPGEICFVSANGWDAHGAAHFGFRSFWLNRAGLAADGLPGRLAGELRSLSELPPALAASG